MWIINRRQFRLKNKRGGLRRLVKPGLIILGSLVGVFVLANLVMGVLYRAKVLPNYSVAAVPIGNIKFDALDERVSVEKILPEEIIFKKDDRSKKIAPKDLGVTVDWDATRQNIKKSRSWLPLTSLFTKHSILAELRLDEAKYAEASKTLETDFTKLPLPERIAFKEDNFSIVAPEAGYKPDTTQLKLGLVKSLEQGKSTFAIPVSITNSTEPTGQLQGELAALQKQLAVKITLVNGGNKKQLTRSEIAQFYEPSGQTLKLSEAKMNQVVAEVAGSFAITPVNSGEAVSASLYALSKSQPVTFLLANQGVRVYNYCAAVKGVSASALPEFRLKLAAVYGDPKGWNEGGKGAFVYAESGCDYTAWLSSAANMTTFSSDVCDNYYSCRVGSNVIINYDRWMGATDPWNAAGGVLEDYRVMVINHETGHWLGFGHRNCPSPGQLAPVMQQQSIDLQGCTFNPWPTATELADL